MVHHIDGHLGINMFEQVGARIEAPLIDKQRDAFQVFVERDLERHLRLYDHERALVLEACTQRMVGQVSVIGKPFVIKRMNFYDWSRFHVIPLR